MCSLGSILFLGGCADYSIGKIEGYISKNKRGKNGFGYDPIFIPNGYSKTFAEMDYKEKLKIDHRQVAYQKLYNQIKVYF